MSIQASTLKQYIQEYKGLSLKMTDCFLFEWLSDSPETHIKTIEENLLAKHTAFLDENKNRINLSDNEFRKYRCNCHRLSFDVYGTTELWFLILHANEMYSESEFCTKEIYLYNKSVLSKISEILSVESSDFSKNRAVIAKEEASLKKKFG